MSKILVVVDMQNDFITGCLGNEECRACVDRVVSVLKNGGYRHVFVTRDTHADNYLQTQEGKNLPVVHCIENTEGWEIHPKVLKALKEEYNEEQITFLNKDTFGSRELGVKIAAYAKESGTDPVVHFVGVCTGICVISNVMITKAFNPELPVKVIADACACVTKESHETALNAMKTCQVEII